jgi:hypothetical protein
MWFTVTLKCDDCGVYATSIDKPHGESLKSEYPCIHCSLPAIRLLNSNFNKAEVEEKTHGGRVRDGHVFKRYTGWEETKRQEDLDYQIQLQYQKKDISPVKEMQKELSRLQEETKKKL